MRRRLFALAAPLAAAAALMVAPGTAVADTSCATNHVCFWSGTNFTGSKVSIPQSAFASVPVYGGLFIEPGASSPMNADLYRSAKNRIASPGLAAAFGASGVLGNIAALPNGADVASFPGPYTAANVVRRVS